MIKEESIMIGVLLCCFVATAISLTGCDNCRCDAKNGPKPGDVLQMKATQETVVVMEYVQGCIPPGVPVRFPGGNTHCLAPWEAIPSQVAEPVSKGFSNLKEDK